jgi:hypothetical protein
MYHLSQAEKYRLEAQVAYATALIRASEPTNGFVRRLSSTFAHPAVVVLLGSGLVALIAGVGVEQYRDSQLQDEKRVEMAETIPLQYHRVATLLVNLARLKLAIASPDAGEQFGLSHSDLVTFEKEVSEIYLKDTGQAAILEVTAARFNCDPAVQGIARDADKLVERLEGLEPPADVQNASDLSQQIDQLDIQVEKNVRDLANSMATAVGTSGKCHTSLWLTAQRFVWPW